VVALAVALLSALAVLALHFPAQLSTPELRARYDVDVLRGVLLAAMLGAGGVAGANLVLGRMRWLNASALAVLIAAAAAGGQRVLVGAPVDTVPEGTPYIGLDWFVLDLFFSSLLFIAIEKLWPLRRGQPVFRQGWQTDLGYFAANHFLVGVLLLATNALVHGLVARPSAALAAAVQAMPVALQVLAVMLVADLVQYGVHRAFHTVPALWRLHRIHHSVEVMDWLAGSRLHVLEVIATRVPVLAALTWIGFDRLAVDLYIVVVGFQAVFNHANVRVALGPLSWLRYVIVLPAFHHWHHGSDREAIDRNYAAHFAFLDHLFGTAVQSPRDLPERYGLAGERLPPGFWAQQASVFRGGRTRG
jgi:sterol desaturase/sphingolipid hydroxylase (fatty acid hydroxylase superfamily)